LGFFFPLHGTTGDHHFAFGTTFGFASSLSNVNQHWVRELVREQHWELLLLLSLLLLLLLNFVGF
jgi:hypothetical protein